jgi:hypothetical protein
MALAEMIKISRKFFLSEDTIIFNDKGQFSFIWWGDAPKKAGSFNRKWK